VRIEWLLAGAVAAGVSVRVRPRPGEHVVAGTTLGWVWTDPPGPGRVDVVRLGGLLHEAVRIGFERTLEQDPGFGLRQLIDAACKALSPRSTTRTRPSRPSTTSRCCTPSWPARPLGDRLVHSPDGSVAVSVPGRSFAALLALGVGLIRRYGAAEPTVIRALLQLLAACLAASGNDPARWTAIEAEAALLVADAERETAQPADLQIVHAAAQRLQDGLAARRAGATEDAEPTTPTERLG
jgi:uncharacterized membrane protein